MGHRLDGLEPPGRPPIAVDKGHGAQPAADGHIASMRIDRQERRFAGRGPLDGHVKIRAEQHQPGIIALAQQCDQRPLIADRPRHDLMRYPGKRE